MKTRNTITRVITITMTMAAVVAALLCGGLLQPVKAQTGNDTVTFVSYVPLGMVPGEQVRVSAANTRRTTGNLSLSFSFYLAHGSNSSSLVPLYESERIEVPPGEIRFSDVSRSDLKTEGEPETERAQLIVKLTSIAPAGSSADDFPVSLEVREEEVESENALQRGSKYRLIIVAAERSKLNAPIGLDPGQRVRYTVFYPPEEGTQTASVTTYTYDSIGRLRSQSHPVELRPGESYTFDVNREELGDEKTGREQMRTSIQILLMDGSVKSVKLSVSMEVLERTGSTTGGDYFTGSVTVSGDGF